MGLRYHECVSNRPMRNGLASESAVPARVRARTVQARHCSSPGSPTSKRTGTNMGKIPIDPALTEHDSMEEALAYDKWFREEVQLSLDEEGDDIPHDQVVANLRARAEARRKARNAG
jgi:hypothetical protein